jgi:mono/diheme cytochrome c family protein
MVHEAVSTSATMSGRAPRLIGFVTAVGLAVGALLVPVRADDPAQEQLEHFEKKVRPILAEHCYKCHSSQAKKLKGGFLLDSRAGLLKGGDSGPAVVPGRPERSRLLVAIGYTDPDLQMPPKGKLSEAAIADLTAWVRAGVPWPTANASKASAAKYTFDLAKRKREHWCWLPLRAPQPPATKDRSWPVDAVDRFLLARMEDKGLRPAGPADRRTLLRRVSFDLIGLPPSPQEVEAFMSDQAPDAFAKVVDRLLASPHYGERWGRHWLDLVRYAESRGHEYDYNLPDAYQYRDYVIRAFNADVPYDRFVTEHLAGDLLDRPRLHPREGFNESILGTGFWFLGEQVHSPVDLRQDKADRFDNMLDVMSKTFLGLTVACARCHDHKFDAISTNDYYALAGFLESSSYRLVRFDALETDRRVAEQLSDLRARARLVVHRALAEAVQPALGNVAAFLLLARDSQRARQGRSPLLEEATRDNKLHRELVKRWVAYVRGPAKDANDSLHAWTAADQLGPLAESWRRRGAQAEAARKGNEVIIDYAAALPGDLIQDGHVFSLVRPGDLSLGEERPGRPAVALSADAVALKDPAWDGLRLAAGAENEPGALGGVVRSGRTLRTPTFRVKGGKVHCLVKGAGHVYAAVDAHVMIAGPLHGALVRPFNTGDRFQWLTLDLGRYQGSTAHVELTASGGAPLAVARVVQAAAGPGSIDRPNGLLMRLVSGENGAAPEALARGYQRLLQDVAAQLAADGPETPDHGRLAAWLLQHLELFAVDADTARQRISEAARPFVVARAKLIAGIKADSRVAPAMLDGNGFDDHVYIRGSYKTPGEPAPRRFLAALTGSDPLAVKRGSGRLELARQMTDPALDPLLPRVMVNRVWHHLFGRGIVASVDNFGVLGEAPTHPELLDYLADRFAKEGWSVKKLLRALALSRAYQMASEPDERARQADPQNLLLHRMPIRRLEGEAIRDAMLMVSGRLDRRVYGPSVPVYLTPFQDGRGRPASGPLDGAGRRSVYLAVRRNFLPSFLLAFDTPIPFSTVGRRTVSNVPAQALILMNDPFVHQQAEVWARKVLAQPGTARVRIVGMYLSAFCRSPTEAELGACVRFLEAQADLNGRRPDDLAAWTALAHVLFNTKEFIFLG